MKSILITGAAGFVGSHLVDRCLLSGYKVIGIDDFSCGVKKNLESALKSEYFYFKKLDLTKLHAVENICNFLKRKEIARVDAVVHLAAKKIPRYGGRLLCIQVNVNSTQTACEVAKKYHSKIIFASTSDVYGMNPSLPFTERSNSIFGPSSVGRWAYGSSKYLDEQLLFGYQEQFGIPIVILRIFSVYGPRQVKGYLGNAVSAFFEQAMEKKKFELHGDGKQTRSFIFIDDLIAGMIRSMTSPKAINQVINLGNAQQITMKDLASKIHHLVNGNIKFNYKYISYASFTGQEYQDVRDKLPDISSAKKLLRWQPKVDLEEGLKKTANWYLTSQ